MREKYTDLTDLGCYWGDATSAILRHIDENEPINAKHGWQFKEGSVSQGIGKYAGYSVVIFSTGYDEIEKKILFLSVQANVSASDEMVVSTVKRCEIDESLKQYL